MDIGQEACADRAGRMGVRGVSYAIGEAGLKNMGMEDGVFIGSVLWW